MQRFVAIVNPSKQHTLWVLDMTLITSFEKDTCMRCGGTGNYSFNQMHGTRCYGCNGKGEKLTPKGRAAHAFYIQSRTIKADKIVVGDTVKAGWMGTMKVITISVTPHDTELHDCIVLTAANGHTFHLSEHSEVLKVMAAECNNRLLLEAVEYQAKLTKKGELMKKHINNKECS